MKAREGRTQWIGYQGESPNGNANTWYCLAYSTSGAKAVGHPLAGNLRERKRRKKE